MAVDKNKRETVQIQGTDRIAGTQVQSGDSVDVYPFQRRHMVAAGSVAGSIEDIASESEKDAYALEVLKRPENRSDIEPWSVQKTFEENDVAPVEPAEEPAAKQQSSSSSSAGKGK